MKIRRFQMKDMDQTIDLYQQCFAEAPWFEVFDPEELAQLAARLGSLFRAKQTSCRLFRNRSGRASTFRNFL